MLCVGCLLSCERRTKSPNAPVASQTKPQHKPPLRSNRTQTRKRPKQPTSQPSKQTQPHITAAICPGLHIKGKRCQQVFHLPSEQRVGALSALLARALYESFLPKGLALKPHVAGDCWSKKDTFSKRYKCAVVMSWLLSGVETLIKQLTATERKALQKQVVEALTKGLATSRFGSLHVHRRYLFKWYKSHRWVALSAFLVKWYVLELKRRKDCPVGMVRFVALHAPDTFVAIAPLLRRRPMCRLATLFRKSGFLTFAAVTKQLQTWARQFPKVLSLQRMGKSTQGRPLWALRLGVKDLMISKEGDRPHVVFVANQHANEHAGADLVLGFVRKLLSLWKQGHPVIKRWLAKGWIWVLPVLNPDGKVFDQSQGLLKSWRYNMSPWGQGRIGIDLNRNYGVHWQPEGKCKGGTSVAPGEKPFQAPETLALKGLLGRLKPLAGMMDLHQLGRLLMRPWGAHKGAIEAKADQGMKKLCQLLQEANGFQCIRAHRIYLHCGSLGDWVWQTHKAASFTVELGCAKYLNRTQRDELISVNVGMLFRFVGHLLTPSMKLRQEWEKLFPLVQRRRCKRFWHLTKRK